MSIDLSIFEDPRINADFIEYLIDERSEDIQSHFSRLWEFYSNRMVWTNTNSASEQSRNYIQAQEMGLPSRITGGLKDIQRKEVVIENDIAWRVNAMVDFLFGKPISIKSLAPEANKQAEIERILKVVFEANGAIGFFQ